MPRILISGNTTPDEYYIQAVSAAGGDCDKIYAPEVDPADYDGLLLCGGGDLTPSLYHGVDSGLNRGIDPVREASDLKMIRGFAALGKPILGVCRGHQILNVAFDGTMVQDLGEKNPVHNSPPGAPYCLHGVRATPGSLPERLYGAEFCVNSSHHQSIGDAAPGFRITSWSEDGVPESIEHELLPIVGVQWHPERLCLDGRREGAVDGLVLIRWFVQQCRKNGAD